jgi:TM2 domain-containing membrane protein YozV
VSTQNSLHRTVAAFTLALVLVPARPLVAQQSFASGAQMSRAFSVRTAERGSQAVQSDTMEVFPLKSEAMAATWSQLVPGGGQFYAGKPGKGFLLLGMAVGGAAIALSCDDGVECLPNLLLGSLVSLTSAGVGMLTAPGDAREYNEKHARRTAIEPVLDRHAGRTGLGLALRY